MRVGLGLYRHMLTQENFQFAKQAGASEIVAHLTDYFQSSPRIPDSRDSDYGWGVCGDTDQLWTYEELRDLKSAVNAEGLELAALENFNPAHWHDILLDGPKKKEQLESVKSIIRNMGRAGIPVMGYNFSLAGVWGHVEGPFARGGAVSVGFLGSEGPAETPIPRGMVWNMIYDPELLEKSGQTACIEQITPDQLWQRLADFLNEVLPVAEECGVRLALHPDDPPMPTLRDTPRLVYQPQYYGRLLSISSSHSNGLEFCIGSLAEMSECDIYDTVDHFSRTGRVCYIHLRNVRGKVPRYHEVFIDEGDVDMVRVLRILHKNGYDGLLIPDHTPQMSCAAPWHAGMAYALGYMRGLIRMIEEQ